MKVLLWKVGALGDVVMTTPLVRQLRARLPDARIDYLVGGAFEAALRGNPHLDRIHAFDERILYRAQVHRLGELLAMLRAYDVVYVLDKHWIFALLARLARIPQRVGFRRRPHEAWGLTHTVAYGPLRHEIDCYLDLMEAAGLRVDRADVALQAPAEEAYAIAPNTTVLVNSGGANPNESSQVRRLPKALFAALVRACEAQGPVAFVGSPAEAADYAPYASARAVNLCGRTNLAQAVSALRQAARVISTDTGLMHLAAAVNPHVTSVFGPTHPARKCPPGARWVWTDAGRYAPAYEVFGEVPAGRFFESLTAEAILGGSQPSPFDGRVARAAA